MLPKFCLQYPGWRQDLMGDLVIHHILASWQISTNVIAGTRVRNSLYIQAWIWSWNSWGFFNSFYKHIYCWFIHRCNLCVQILIFLCIILTLLLRCWGEKWKENMISLCDISGLWIWPSQKKTRCRSTTDLTIYPKPLRSKNWVLTVEAKRSFSYRQLQVYTPLWISQRMWTGYSWVVNCSLSHLQPHSAIYISTQMGQGAK